MSTQPKERSPLLPDRRGPEDFFVCDVFDSATPKGDIASMEHPIYSLSTKPDYRIRKYENNGNYIEVKPSADGLATVHDRDVLIYCVSQLIAAINAGRPVSQVVRFKAFDLLKATNRMTNGQGYEALKAAFDRLAGTRISTNIVTGGEETYSNFGILDAVQIVRETRDGRMQEIEVKLSDWVFRAIEHHEVLTLHRDYFRLRKPIERRLYEIARKHCGKQREWRISLEKLQLKCGSSSTLKEFRRLVGAIVEEDAAYQHMPDYSVSFEGDDMVVFRGRGNMAIEANGVPEEDKQIAPPLSPEAYHDARTVAPGWDVYYLEQEWRQWITEPPRDADAAYVGFCRKWYEKRGAPR
ncbi:MAG: replication initiator protein A [Pirellulaceae bacterium]